MSHKFFIGIAAAFFAVFAIGIAAVVGITRMSEKTTISDVSSSVPSIAPRAATALVAFQPTSEAAPAPTANTVTPVVGASTGLTVSDTDINRLASAVKLDAQNTGDVGKDIWAKETPVAERLLNGMCDCDQRNWLTHFVKAGKEAVSGSENYYQSVQVLASLRRSNTDSSPKPPAP